MASRWKVSGRHYTKVLQAVSTINNTSINHIQSILYNIYLVLYTRYIVSLLLSSFWTSCGLRCHLFSPPVRAFSFNRAKGSAFPLLVDFHRMNVANSRFRAFRESICTQEKSLRIYTSVHSGGLELTKLTYCRHEDNLLRHRGDW